MRFSIIRLLSVSILALLFIGGTTAYGQGTSASLTGQVTDSSGAVVPGATVTATSAETNLAQTAAANGDGIYLIAPLRPAITPLRSNPRDLNATRKVASNFSRTLPRLKTSP